MKINRIYIIVFVLLLAIIAGFLIGKNTKSTLKKEGRDFAVSDTSNITKIFMADKSNNSVLLSKDKNGRWILDNEFSVHRESMDLFLSTILNLDILEPVSEAAHNTVITLLASSSVKVEIYQIEPLINLFGKVRLFPREKRTKTYYVGQVTQANIGTQMLMEGAENPYIVYIPGFRGFVASRFNTNADDWRDRIIFHSRLNEIDNITIEFPEYPENSFKVSNYDNRTFGLQSLSTGEEIHDFDTLKVLNFITAFDNLRFEDLKNDIDERVLDSITSSKPFHIITLNGTDGSTNMITTFHKASHQGEFNLQGEPVLYDRDRFYALINDGEDFVLVQFFVFGKIIRPLSFYLKP